MKTSYQVKALSLLTVYVVGVPEQTCFSSYIEREMGRKEVVPEIWSLKDRGKTLWRVGCTGALGFMMESQVQANPKIKLYDSCAHLIIILCFLL